MPATRTLVLCKSVHHGNTARVAERIAAVLDAAVVAPEEVPYTALDACDVVGFGSGVSYGSFHEAVWNWVDGLPDRSLPRQAAFLFSTSGLPCLWRLWHGPIRRLLARKGFDVVDEFHCRGFDSWGPLWMAGGINRRHPDGVDLDRAAAFAERVRAIVEARSASAIRGTPAALKAG